MRKIYEELNLSQAIELNSINKDLDRLEYAANRLAIVFKVPVVEIYKREVEDIFALDNKLSQLESLPIAAKLKDKIKIGGKWFKVDYNVSKLTAGQFIDIQHFASTDPAKNVHKILASVIRPIGGWWGLGKVQEYNGDNHEEISNHLLEHMTILQAYPITLFFCQILNNSLKDIQTYSLNQLRELERKLKETNLQKNGDGLPQ
jgi:hypothetical protein